MPTTYTLAAAATSTGVPVVRPLYVDFPDQQEAYAAAGSEYLFGPDVLVAPATQPGETATTRVWFPGGSDWTDWFTGTTYAGGSTADVTTGLDAMPVFVQSGGVVATRTADVANDTAPLSELTLTTATGADGSFSLYEDDGVSTDPAASATTRVTFTDAPDGGALDVAPTDGSFAGQVAERAVTAVFTDAERPQVVRVDGEVVDAATWSYDEAARRLSVPVESRSVDAATRVEFSTTAVAVPEPGTDPAPGAGTGAGGGAPTQGSGTAPGAVTGSGDARPVASTGGPLAFTGSAGLGSLLLAAAGLVTGGLVLRRLARRRSR